MLYRVEVAYRKEIPDPLATGILADIRELGIGGVTGVKPPAFFSLRRPRSKKKSKYSRVNFSRTRL